jgi:predicted acyltransferase
LCAYALLLKLVPVPGFGAGVLQPQGNLSWYIDSNLLAGHTWLGAPTPGFDPEGILSTMGAIATAMFGVFTGQFLRSEKTPEDKTIRMFAAGACLMFAGTVLDYIVPINKNMWTSSYAVFMAGLALVVFALCYWLIDVRGMHRARTWTTPFEIYGQNPIVLYALSELLAEIFWMVNVPLDGGTSVSLQGWYYQHVFLPVGDPMVASFLHSVAFVLLFFGIAWGMNKMGLFVRL